MAILEPDQMTKVLQSVLDDAGVAHAVDFSMTAHVKYQLLRINSGLSEEQVWKQGAGFGSTTKIENIHFWHLLYKLLVSETCLHISSVILSQRNILTPEKDALGV